MKLGRKLKPARKAWKRFTTKLQTKLPTLKAPKTLRTTTKKLNTTFLSILSRSQRKQASHSKPLAILQTQRRHQHSYKLHHSFDPVYIDDLFKAPAPSIEPLKPSKNCDKGAPTDHHAARDHSSTSTQAWEHFDEPISVTTVHRVKTGSAPSNGTVTSDGLSMQELTGVDERAEQFIAEFRREMSLQRQRSFKEYQEMLERSVL